MRNFYLVLTFFVAFSGGWCANRFFIDGSFGIAVAVGMTAAIAAKVALVFAESRS